MGGYHKGFEPSRDMRLPHPCAHSGCPTIVFDGTRHCDLHKGPPRRKRRRR
jgi:hypothetical protein